MSSRIRDYALLMTCNALLSPGTYAADEEGGPWSGKVVPGYLATSGNTRNSNLNTSFEIGY